MGLGREASSPLMRDRAGIRRKTGVGHLRRHADDCVAHDNYRLPDTPEQQAIVATTNGYRFIHLD